MPAYAPAAIVLLLIGGVATFATADGLFALCALVTGALAYAFGVALNRTGRDGA